MISQTIGQFFASNDPILRFIVFSYYVNKCTINKIAVTLRNNSDKVPMQPYAGKSNIRVPSLDYFKRQVKNELILAKAIIHKLLVKGFVILRNCSERAVNVKIKY